MSRDRAGLRLRLGVCAFVVISGCKQDPSPPSAAPTPTPSTSAITATSASAESFISPAPSSSDEYLGRERAQPMSYEGAWWLDRDHRDDEQKPSHVLDVIGAHEGQSIADIGCGSGYFSVQIAKRVGPSGRVLATDIQPEMLALLKKKTDAMKITNVVAVLATESDAKLPSQSIDIALLVDVYHELAHPRETMLQVKAALRPGGKLVLVEYRAEDPKVEIKPEHKMTLPQIRRELEAATFDFVTSDESLPQQRIVIFTPSLPSGHDR